MASTSPPPWETAQRELYRGRFGEDVDAYDRTRPVAPDAVFDHLTRLAGLAIGDRLLEIGPGTGQATRQLGQRGLNIVAVEIDGRLAARARVNLAGFTDVEVREASFETFDASGETFDAIVACNSFHWIAHEVRFAKSAALLRSEGHLAVLSTPAVVPDDADSFWWDVQDDWASVGAERVDPSTKHPDLVGDLAASMESSGLFDEVRTTRHPFAASVSASDYVTNLSTQSGFRQLGPDAGRKLLPLVKRRIDEAGGFVTVHRLAVLTVGRRALE